MGVTKMEGMLMNTSAGMSSTQATVANFIVSRAVWTRKLERGRGSKGAELRSDRGRGRESRNSIPSGIFLGHSFMWGLPS